MISKQSMAKRIKFLQRQARDFQNQSNEAAQDAERLLDILRREVQEGRGTLGDPALDLAFMASGELDSLFAECFGELRDRWSSHSGEYFLVVTRQQPPRIPHAALRRTSVCLGIIEGEARFSLNSISLPINSGKLVILSSTESAPSTSVVRSERVYMANLTGCEMSMTTIGFCYVFPNNNRPDDFTARDFYIGDWAVAEWRKSLPGADVTLEILKQGFKELHSTNH